MSNEAFEIRNIKTGSRWGKIYRTKGAAKSAWATSGRNYGYKSHGVFFKDQTTFEIVQTGVSKELLVESVSLLEAVINMKGICNEELYQRIEDYLA